MYYESHILDGRIQVAHLKHTQNDTWILIIYSPLPGILSLFCLSVCLVQIVQE